MKAKEIIDKVIECLKIAIAPVSAICLVWGIDVSAYIAGGAGVIISVLEYVKLFLKD